MSINEKQLRKYKKTLGNRVKHIRLSKGYSLNDLASISNFEKTSISRIENGRTNITYKTALILCLALEIELKELFDFEEIKLINKKPKL